MHSSTLVFVFILSIIPYNSVKCFSAPRSGGEYDFIVVGAGSAGSVITNRLSENGKYTVLLLEKGPEPSILSRVPALCPVMFFSENGDRKFVMEEEPGVGLGLVNNRVPWVRGKGLGGTSLINFMMHVRGHKEDYDRWAAMGNPGWSYEEVLPYFKKSEDANIPHFDQKYRSKGGELGVQELNYKTGLTKAFIKGCNQSGLDILDDYNNGNQFGAGYLQATLRNGKRCDVYTAFLKDIRYRRNNLKILTHALVTKLLLEDNTVIGVEYKRGFNTYIARARREVILSAGAYQSPQILMLSGIGPKKHLQELGIHVVKDLPVGELMYDHIAFHCSVFRATNKELGFAPQTHDFFNPLNWINFKLSGQGPLQVPSLVVEAVAFIKTPMSKEKKNIPDVELIFTSNSLATDLGLFLRKEIGMTDDSFNKFFIPLIGKTAWMAVPMLYHPKSRGYLKLRSKNPEDSPKLYGNYYTDPENHDMKTMIAAIREFQKIAKSPALRQYGSEPVLTPFDGCEDLEPDSDDFWECQLRRMTISLWHQISTCKMGPKDDPEAVVDNKLRVYGIKKLRVADTSIIPRPLSVHTNVPSIMIGEKAADMILKKYNKQ